MNHIPTALGGISTVSSVAKIDISTSEVISGIGPDSWRKYFETSSSYTITDFYPNANEIMIFYKQWMNVTLLKCVEPGARNREGSFVGGRC
jgi:hypothetical protein